MVDIVDNHKLVAEGMGSFEEVSGNLEQYYLRMTHRTKLS